jgi:hypothetical protein
MARDMQDEFDPDLRAYHVARLGALDRERSSYWPTWKDIAQHCAPRRGRFLSAGADQGRRGARRDHRLIDNTPLLAARTMASGMMAGISSPARPWFRLRLADEAANQAPAVRGWLDEVQRRLLHVFARSNLYNCLHTLYGELGTFGTAVLWVDEDHEDIVRGYTLTAGEYWLASSRRLAVDTLYRTMWWTARQVVDSFGIDVVSPSIRSACENGRLDQEFEIVHALEPNPRASAHAPQAGWAGHLGDRFPVRSVWFERSTQGERSLLRVSGYGEFPAMCPRWETAGSDTYGWGPGWTALGDSQQLQVQQRRKIEAIDRMVKPPMVGPPSLRNEPASLLPGGITYLADPSGQSFRPAIDVRIDLAALGNDILETQGRIKSAFYADLFLMLAETDRREITAREIDERHEEKMLMLGPVLERLHEELLDPLVMRVFRIMGRMGLLPPPPPEVPLAGLQVEFISILAQAQKAVSAGAIERFWQFGAQIGAVKPEALDRLDADGTMDAYADILGVPGKTVVALATAQQARQVRARATAQQDQIAAAERLASIGKTASGIDVGGGQNAVSALLGRS